MAPPPKSTEIDTSAFAELGVLMSFDPMGAAVDWLDAYRAGDLETILEMYNQDAVICCGCGGIKTVAGVEGRRVYWTHRLIEYPVSALANLQPAEMGAMITYLVREDPVSAVLRFNSFGQILAHTCAPSSR